MEGLQGKRCLKCGHCAYPAHARCPKCRGTQFEDFMLKNGKLITHTVLYATPPGVERPLYLGVVEFAGRVRALVQLSADSYEQGMEVVAERAKLREKESKWYIGVRFRKNGQAT